MAVATHHSTTESTAVQSRPRLFTIDELEAMVRQGIIGQDERVELIEGQIVKMNPQGTGHIWAVNRTTRIFNRRDDVVASAQNTLELADGSGPEPDVAVLRATTSENQRPSSKDVLLVVEVADSSLGYDRQTKAPLYARAGIPEYWIVDLNGERIEVYTEPSPAGYRAMRLFLRGEQLSPAFAADLTIQTDTILGPAQRSGVSDQPSADETTPDH